MSLKQKFMKRTRDSNHWIMYHPESLVILMLMGSGIAVLAFGSFALMFGMMQYWFLMGLFAVMSLLSLKQFITTARMIKKLGLKDALGGFTAAEFIWKRDKKWKKIDYGYGGKNGNGKGDGKVSCSAGCESDKEDAGEQRQDSGEPERANPWSSVMLERINSDKGNSKDNM